MATVKYLDENGLSTVWSKVKGIVTPKADKVSGATNGHLAGLNSSGNLTDSGLAASNVAQKDGSYSGMTVGAAEDLVSAESVASEFTSRITGGSTAVGKGGTALVDKIKGRTLVWNQRVAPDAEYAGTLTTKDTSVTTENKYVETTTTASSGRSLSFSIGADIAPGHKALVIWIIKSDYASAPYLRYTKTTNVYGNINISNYVADAWNVVYSIIDEGIMFVGNTGIIPSGANHIQGKYLSTPLSGGLKVFDLTLMFGAGNEPTIEEFKALFPEYDYTYNEGELVNNGRQTEYDLLWNQNEDLPSNLRVTDGSGLTATWDNAQQAIKVVIPSGTRSSNVSVAWGATTTTYRTSGHKYLYLFRVSDNIKPSMGYGSCWWQNTTTSSVSSDIITKDTAGLQIQHAIYFGTSIAAGTYYFCPMSFDLTAMFGAGNEPSTPGEFRDMFPNLYYAYDAGTQQHFSFEQLKSGVETIGFNQWDEEWENGLWSTTGTKTSQSAANIRCANKIPVIPGATYYFYTASRYGSGLLVGVFYKDGSYTRYSVDTNRSWVAPANAESIVFCTTNAANVGTYNNDICFNLSDTSRNGTYEPYWRSELELGLGDIKVKSHNIWDEVWEVGDINASTGANDGSTTQIRSKNYIPVEAGRSYHLVSKVYKVAVYNSEKQFIERIKFSSSEVDATIPSGGAYIRFSTVTNYGNTYLNDIAINLSDPAFDGRYEPYGDGGVITLTGGLKSAGTVYDEISGGKLVKRIESVDLGSFTWYMIADSNPSLFYTANIEDARKRINNQDVSNIVTTKYPVDLWVNANDKTIKIGGSGYSRIYIYDSAYSDPATFKAAMAGVPLYYELATPIEYELADAIPTAMRNDPYGTERRLPADTAGTVLAPFRADITYSTNIKEAVQSLPQNYINVNSMQDFLAALGAQMGGTWTMRPADGKFDFTFTPNPSNE